MEKDTNDNQIAADSLLVLVHIDSQKDLFEIEGGRKHWYKCPKCGNENVSWKDIYCEECKCEFEWSGPYPNEALAAIERNNDWT